MSAPATPATVAALLAARKTKPAPAPAVKAPARPAAPVAPRGGVVTLTLRPKSLSDWKRWTHDLGVAGSHMDSTGTALVAHITYGGVPARLVGEGVPALLRAHRPTARKAVAHV